MESEPWFLWMLGTGAKGLAITGIAAVLVCMLGRHAAIKHLVAALALISLLVLPLVSVSLPAWTVPLPQTWSHQPDTSTPPPSSPRPVVAPHDESPKARAAHHHHATPTPSIEAPSPTAAPTAQVPANPVSWAVIITLLWALIMSVALGFRGLGWLALYRLRKQSISETNPAWLAQLSATKERLGIRREVILRRSNVVQSPCLVAPPENGYQPRIRLRRSHPFHRSRTFRLRTRIAPLCAGIARGIPSKRCHSHVSKI